jgi:hypothetical protein
MLIVETPCVRTEVTARGRWEQPVATYARLLITVARKLPKTGSITLLYSNGRLYFDRVSIEANLAPGMRLRHAELGDMPEWAPTPARSPTPAVVEHGQFLMPGLAPVSDRERLELLAKAPMRPGRR